ncbi:indolepyruvate oxidoreductase subunit beta [uncultured Anaerovibrio sp.]|uniref:indolepyruvate oxidoreductase subunit beta n=1 Tax=uncultured Anaerovibrio sp. TaxID=361586 RepID=UPI0026241C3C|nr:indolepyruvate oxidoreductase subunit beta [uncultured Anaerovibrio sp.]
MSKNIILCGVGGQGTILASKLISGAAMNKGMAVKSAETIGMAQRGGSVFSHLRLGEGADCPMIASGCADIIIGFEPGETVRLLPYLKKEGQVIVSTRPVMPVTAALAGSDYNGSEMLDYIRKKVKRVIAIDTERVCRELGSTKIVNLLLLGAAVKSGALGLDEEDIRKVILDRIPPKFHELNFKALEYAKNI